MPWQRIGTFTLSFGGFIVLWKLASTFLVSPYIIPPPDDVLRTALPMLLSGEIARHIGASLGRVAVGFALGSVLGVLVGVPMGRLGRVAVGFALGSVLGVLVGVPMGRLRWVHDLLDPIVEFFRFLSPTAMIPIAVVWFGIGETSKYFLIFWGSFFVVLLNALHGVMATPAIRVRAAECLGATPVQIFRRIVLPSSVPSIVTGMRVALALSYMAIIPAEILAADSGLGYLLQQSSLLLQTNRVFVVLAVFGILGGVSDWLFRVLTTRLLARYLDVGARG